MADERTVVIAMDGSDYSDYAFDCKYYYSFIIDIVFLKTNQDQNSQNFVKRVTEKKMHVSLLLFYEYKMRDTIFSTYIVF